MVRRIQGVVRHQENLGSAGRSSEARCAASLLVHRASLLVAVPRVAFYGHGSLPVALRVAVGVRVRVA